jgi:hypothetical protein
MPKTPSQLPQTPRPGLQDKLKDGSPAPKMFWLPGGLQALVDGWQRIRDKVLLLLRRGGPL